MLDIAVINQSILRTIKDSSEDNLKEVISHLRRFVC